MMMTIKLFIIVFIKVFEKIIVVGFAVILIKYFVTNCFGSRLFELYIFRVVVVTAGFDYFEQSFAVIN